MAENSKKLYMEMQMDELKATLEEQDGSLGGDEKSEVAKKKSPPKNNQNKNAEVAKLYEDAYEYEEELAAFEAELEIIKANELHDITKLLAASLPDEDRNYDQEFHAILTATWAHRVEVEKTHPQEQLALIQKTEFTTVVEEFNTAFPNYEHDFKADIKDIFIKRLEMLVAIKKEHIEQEIEEIYIAGLKPSFVKRIYKQFHSIK
ncbi:MAG: hypothetical protein Q9M32_01850 [Sulfurimonas sp.]|nr:hypothetical protein [Sulfurimonas sp.]MDQ7060332.1 hypothetical protein [Sulfurimonas sp.]